MQLQVEPLEGFDCVDRTVTRWKKKEKPSDFFSVADISLFLGVSLIYGVLGMQHARPLP